MIPRMIRRPHADMHDRVKREWAFLIAPGVAADAIRDRRHVGCFPAG